ncbi:MAG TPA: NTP pyrophosphohydrolase [Verrucomicrobia bacterium]|nr:NTP pyrophosphohydrolase [Verrucomicrobiota bacterium]
MIEELFEIVDESGRVLGTAPRKRCHGDPSLMHQSVHVFVFDRLGRLFLQKRSLSKDIQPGKWDTSVGGHVQPGEKPEAAARREMLEELGVSPESLAFQYQYIWRSTVETELVRSFIALHDGPFKLDPSEIDDGRFWALSEIRAQLGQGVFTTNFEYELGMNQLIPPA